MRRILTLVVLLWLAACGRPLTPSETAYLAALQGDETNPARVRLYDGHFAGSVTYQIPVRPRVACSERIWPPSQGGTVTVSPGATVVFHNILFRKDLYSPDMMKGWPHEIDLFSAMLFAHEMTHVWQWQNRDRTGYHPLKALREHATQRDPYLFDPDSATRSFLDFGYEQQGAIVEEYVCCRLLDPDAPRTARLRALIAQEMPIGGLDAVLDRPHVRLPWRGADTEAICSAPPDSGR